MKRLIKGLSAQLGATLLIAATSAAQSNPLPPAGDPAAAGVGAFGVPAGAGGFGGGTGGSAAWHRSPSSES